MSLLDELTKSADPPNRVYACRRTGCESKLEVEHNAEWPQQGWLNVQLADSAKRTIGVDLCAGCATELVTLLATPAK